MLCSVTLLVVVLASGRNAGGDADEYAGGNAGKDAGGNG